MSRKWNPIRCGKITELPQLPDDDQDLVDGWNVVDIDGRVYCEPNQTYYNKNNFLTKVDTEKMMELGGYAS